MGVAAVCEGSIGRGPNPGDCGSDGPDGGLEKYRDGGEVAWVELDPEDEEGTLKG